MSSEFYEPNVNEPKDELELYKMLAKSQDSLIKTLKELVEELKKEIIELKEK